MGTDVALLNLAKFSQLSQFLQAFKLPASRQILFNFSSSKSSYCYFIPAKIKNCCLLSSSLCGPYKWSHFLLRKNPGLFIAL